MFLALSLSLFLAVTSAHLCSLNPVQRGGISNALNKNGANECLVIDGPCGSGAQNTPPFVMVANRNVRTPLVRRTSKKADKKRKESKLEAGLTTRCAELGPLPKEPRPLQQAKSSAFSALSICVLRVAAAVFQRVESRDFWSSFVEAIRKSSRSLAQGSFVVDIMYEGASSYKTLATIPDTATPSGYIYSTNVFPAYANVPAGGASAIYRVRCKSLTAFALFALFD